MVDDLISIIHDLLYSLTILEFTEEERTYIINVIKKSILLIRDTNRPG